jgi:hypothetical protein
MVKPGKAGGLGLEVSAGTGGVGRGLRWANAGEVVTMAIAAIQMAYFINVIQFYDPSMKGRKTIRFFAVYSLNRQKN